MEYRWAGNPARHLFGCRQATEDDWARVGAHRAAGPSESLCPVSPGLPLGFGGFPPRSGRPRLDKTGRSGDRGAFFPSRAPSGAARLDGVRLRYGGVARHRQGTHPQTRAGFLLSAARTAQEGILAPFWTNPGGREPPRPCVAPERFQGGFRAINARGSPCWNLRAATPASDARRPGPKNRSGTGGGRRRSGRCAPPAVPAATRSSGRGAG